jgi:hypothetical protein
MKPVEARFRNSSLKGNQLSILETADDKNGLLQRGRLRPTVSSRTYHSSITIAGLT